VMERGKVVRSAVQGVPAKGRDTMGVVFAKPDNRDRIIAIARNTERGLGGDDEELPAAPDGPALDAAGGAGTDPDAEPGQVGDADDSDTDPNRTGDGDAS